MAEFEILEALYLNEEIIWSLMQWWVSVSFGLIALGHFLGKKLGIFLVVLLVVAYVVFSVYVTLWITIRGTHSYALLTDLMTMRSEGALSSSGGVLIDTLQIYTPYTSMLNQAGMVGLALSSIGYLVVCYWRGRNAAGSAPSRRASRPRASEPRASEEGGIR